MRAYLTLALILSISLPTSAAETTTTPIKTSLAPQNDLTVYCAKPQLSQPRLSPSQAAFSRLVRDLATWDFVFVLQNPQWVVAEVVPPETPTYWVFSPKRAGAPRLLEKVTDETAPELKEDSDYIRMYEGTLKLLAPLDRMPETAVWHYRVKYEHLVWEEKHIRYDVSVPYAIGSEGAEEYSAFRDAPVGSESRNIVLCLVPQSLINIQTINSLEKLNPAYPRPFLINEALLPHVAAAQTFYRANRQLFSKAGAPENRARLHQLLEGENPFLFAAAVRTLVQSGELSSEFIAKRMLTLDPLRQGILVYSMLLNSPAEPAKICAGAIQAAIGETKDSAQFEGVFFATECASRAYDEIIISRRVSPNIKGRYSLPIPPVDRRVSPLPSLLMGVPLRLALLQRLKSLGLHSEMDKHMMTALQLVQPPPLIMTPKDTK